MRPSEPENQATAAREIALAGAFCALGVVVPILFHMVGMGRFFLPMHLPVLLAGLLLGPRIAWAVGLAVPWLSSALTGMPPMPTPILMSAELVALAEIASALVGCGVPVWLASVGAIGGRCAVTWLTTLALAPYLGLPAHAAGWASIVSGAPGIVLQIVVAPTVALGVLRGRRPPAPSE